MRTLSFSLFTLFIVMSGCGDDSLPSSSPELSFIGMSKDTMIQSSVNEDSTHLRFRFFDADGDLSAVANNIVVIDTRDGAVYNTYSFPDLPIKRNQPAEGEFTILLPTVCCIFPDNIQPCEAPPQFPTNDLVVEVFLLDEAGNESNRVKSGVITLLCN